MRAVHLDNQESLEQEVDPADSGQVDLGVIANSVDGEKVLGVDLHNGLGPQIQKAQRLESRPGSVAQELVLEQFQGHAVQAHRRGCHRR